MNSYSVYILRCRDGLLYTGIAIDVARRVREHNDGKLAAKYTRGRRPVQLVYVSYCGNRSNALKAEAQIKRLSRAEKLRLCGLSE